MSLLDPKFEKWPIGEHGKGYQASKTAEYVDLHETSVQTPRMPWEFRAYRKTLQIGGKLISKRMVCSRPKQPTTRPTLEQCCADKYVQAAVEADQERSCSLMRA